MKILVTGTAGFIGYRPSTDVRGGLRGRRNQVEHTWRLGPERQLRS